MNAVGLVLDRAAAVAQVAQWRTAGQTVVFTNGVFDLVHRGHVASLNVSVAGAIILYEAARQREVAGLYDRCRLDPATYRELLFEWSYPAAARHCRARGIPYPDLDAEGFIVTRKALAASLRAERPLPGKARRTSGAGS